MSNNVKFYLASAALLILWCLFVGTGTDIARTVVFGVAGWQVGGWIYKLARRWFPK